MATQAFFKREQVPLAANQARKLGRAGEYFAILGSTGSFEIGIEDQPLSDWAAGLRVANRPDANGRRPNFEYLRVRDTSGAPNVLDIVVGAGEFSDQRLTVSGTVAVQGVANGTPVAVALYGSTLGASRASVVSVIAGALNLVTPAANVNGLVLRDACVLTSSAGASLLADTVAPTAKEDGHVILMASSGQGVALAYPVLVPAGFGIYTRNDGAGALANISYDLL